ncbi:MULTISPECIES: RHS repeat-associated core domain-containing protein [unclassified Parabacteroides]|uniref:RHS repeat domain-containing protein n=1 Tax=unclassified Parabacteroides TaxID=2649774 RepID=UPI002475CB08|nr:MULTISPECIES: RHS repeat-associated core domain-containing protein [unclassified Parabacteroides]
MYVGSGYIENNVYHCYLKDYLGNTRMVATPTDSMYQWLSYYPFGMLYGDRGDQGRQQMKYGGKEFDDKHGLYLYDFEARYYDPALGGFLTMDPLAEKYYSTSPYAYCANNPMNAIDPDGKKIVYITRNSKNEIKQQYTFKNGYFVDDSGKKFTSDDTANKLAQVYRKILDSDNKELIHKLRTIDRSKNTHYIEKGITGGGSKVYPLGTSEQFKKGEPIGTALHLDISLENKRDFELAKGIKSSDMSTVVHELQHQYDYDIGNMMDNTGKSSSENPSEIRAVELENIARALEELDLRKKY